MPVDGLADHGASLAAQLAALDDQSGRLARLAQEETAARRAYVAAAEELSKARAKAARRLDTAVNTELPPLKLDKARFAARLEPLPDADWGEHGRERVVFEITTNPGMPPGPLSKIASGGELSRFLLALKVVLAEADPVPTLIFDEVDSGVGGATAAAVGERLVRLGRKLQVLVVTHSPQVAAVADRHWLIRKTTTRSAASTDVLALDPRAGARRSRACCRAPASPTKPAPPPTA